MRISEGYLRQILQTEDSFIIVAEEDGIVGLAFAFIVYTLTRKLFYCDNTVVRPDYRRRGIAKEFDKMFIQLARIADCDCLELVVPTENVAIQMKHLKSGAKFRPQLPMGLILKKWKRESEVQR